MPATPATTAGPASMKAIPSTWTKSYPSNSLTMMRPHHVSNSCAIDGPAVSIKAANPSTLAIVIHWGFFNSQTAQGIAGSQQCLKQQHRAAEHV
eukprot:CAMPEP_0204152764 /NCGR_PEP_ID=MMETSP0361-20130328/27297_1 /ASSEMBLY_ACC=CAM_ASM_000343 /TAXON_ID=268821 /ORGANISM="Scrippsiella Hangoei, Strain SHTV-5" /LENGTH=93 /DNA_ID=CAMNT_0051107783 /DNA_START=67 /DNA_END=349 /DNA_ORIENTATION=-